ncbi:hypothetical protein LCM17_00010 [Cereibacter sphaeroides]|nr:hypothetical protein [Cereibacter sphaeroides]
MIRAFLVASLAILPIVSAVPLAAQAEPTIAETYRIEIDTAWAAFQTRFGHEGARATLDGAMRGAGATESLEMVMYWAGGMAMDTRLNGDPYWEGSRALRAWDFEIRFGDIDPEEAAAALAGPMAAFRALHEEVTLNAETALYHMVQRGLAYDAARAQPYGSSARDAWSRQSDAERDLAHAAMTRLGSWIQVIPMPYEEGAGLGAVAGSARALDQARARLGLSADSPMRSVLGFAIGTERLRGGRAPETLRRAWSSPDGTRWRYYSEGGRQVAEQLGILAPTYAAGLRGRALTREDITTISSLANGLIAFRDDLRDPFSPASPAARLGAALHALLFSGEIAEGRVAPEVLKTLMTDLGTIFSRGVSPVAPFGLPGGIVAEQAEVAGRAIRDAAEVIEGLSDIMAGRPGGQARAERAADRLQGRLQGPEWGRSVTRGAMAGIGGNAPFVRSIIGGFL